MYTAVPLTSRPASSGGRAAAHPVGRL